MRRLATFLIILATLSSLAFSVWWWFDEPGELISPLGRQKRSLPLERYYLDNLRQRGFLGSEIKLEEVIVEEETYTAWLFSYQSEGKRVTGMANLPKMEGQLPVVVMLRGYADKEIYFTGLGTRKAAGVYAENGFITLAPDFLGFGGSDEGSGDILGARFERPVTVLNLLASIKNWSPADPDKIFLWGHSNGGQIALSVLEVSRAGYPTTLWAPVTKGFPESVLAYMGELDDNGLKVKRAIDKFRRDYEEERVSIANFWADIQAPIQLHQGLVDPLIDEEWSEAFVETLRGLDKEIEYYEYRWGDHNLKSDWDLVVQRDLDFFNSF